MNKYEAMFIIRADLSEEEKKTLLGQIDDAVIKNNGSISSSSVWAERKKLSFPIKKYHEGTYYLLNFSVAPSAIVNIRDIYKLNENIIRLLITVAS